MKLWLTYDEEAQYVGRIEQEEEGGVQLETLPKPYWQYKERVKEKKAKMMAARRTCDHAINLMDEAEPPFSLIYQMSAHQVNQLDNYFKKRLAEGKIADSESPYHAPILFVPQPDGCLQLCVDYRNLNKLTIWNKYPLRLMDGLRDRVAGGKGFTKLDLKHGYHLVQIRKRDEHKMGFCTRYRQYEYKLMPFALIHPPARFQTIINKILREFLDQGVVVYLDHILIYADKY